MFILALLVGCGGGSSYQPPPGPLQVTSQSALPFARINTAYGTTLNATGGTMPYAWSLASGNLPAGVTVNRAGVLSGTPTASGVFQFTMAVLDSEQPPSMATSGFSLTVAATLQVTTTSLPNGFQSVPYSATLAAAGGYPPYSWTITQGTLPGGLTLNATTGTISGTPTAGGISSFTVQVSDNVNPAATASASLSITIAQPPARNTAMYVDAPFQPVGGFDQTGLKIQSDGSLALLPSSPETAINGTQFASSPKLPLLFLIAHPNISVNPPIILESLLVNQDYSLTSLGSASLPVGGEYSRPVVDPTGSNLYLAGTIDGNGTTGITIFTADGSFQSVGTITIPGVNFVSGIAFKPDGSLAFVSACTNAQCSILSYSRNSDGTLVPAATYNAVSGGSATGPMLVSPDGRYLVTTPSSGGPVPIIQVQIYSIANDGTLSVLTQPFTVIGSPGGAQNIDDIAWDQSGSFLIASTDTPTPHGLPSPGGMAVLSFSGSALTQTVYPDGSFIGGRLQQAGSFVYVMSRSAHATLMTDIFGFDFQNGQLIPLPGSPYAFGNGFDMVIY